MKSCEYDGDALDEARSHPWTDSVTSESNRYHDLKAQPELIRSALEDFVPWSRYAAVTRFYELLESLNGSASTLESNDCAFSGPDASEASQFGKLQCQGRVMALYRELTQNLSRSRVDKLSYAIHVGLAKRDQDFEPGMVGTTITPVRYLALPEAGDGQLGFQLTLSFWAWGDTEKLVMENLHRVMKNLSDAIGDATA